MIYIQLDSSFSYSILTKEKQNECNKEEKLQKLQISQGGGGVIFVNNDKINMCYILSEKKILTIKIHYECRKVREPLLKYYNHSKTHISILTYSERTRRRHEFDLSTRPQTFFFFKKIKCYFVKSGNS